MKPDPRFVGVLSALVTAMFALSAYSQVLHRRPFAPGPQINYGFDNNAGAAGCQDYNCGTRCYDGHTGTDFPIPLGTPVLAGAAGSVVAINNGCPNIGAVGNMCGASCGNWVQIQHSNGSRSMYCHMQLNSIAVAVGAQVRCGQMIGLSASSGNSSGPHLHYGHKISANVASSESFRGRCTMAAGVWRDQQPYPACPGDQCGCVASAETCNNLDDDCDGRIDNGLSRPCYTGPAGTSGQGLCRSGTETCGAGRWGTCVGQELPRAEVCNQLDDNCDGRLDDGTCAMDGGVNVDATTSDRPTQRDSTTSFTDAPLSADTRQLGDGNTPRRDAGALGELDSGCGCRVGGSPNKQPSWTLVVIGVALAVLRRHHSLRRNA